MNFNRIRVAISTTFSRIRVELLLKYNRTFDVIRAGLTYAWAVVIRARKSKTKKKLGQTSRRHLTSRARRRGIQDLCSDERGQQLV